VTEPVLLVIAALAGYLVGSISFARIVGRLVSPSTDLAGATIDLGEVGMRDGMQVRMDGISATSLSVQLGRRWGGLVSLLDILKAVVVTLAFRLVAPDEPAYLVAAVFVVVGHNWPVWYGFHGGFGVSPMLGGMIVVDWLGLVLAGLAGKAVGLALRDRMLMFDGWTLFLVPWFLVVRQEPAEVLYAVAIVVLYWARTLPMRREILRQRRS
jgi:glycerol-3-phosphate acyltransferase PlsY